MYMFLSKDTLEGDQYAQGLVKKFLTEFVERFSISESYHWDQVLQQLLDMELNELYKTEKYNLLHRDTSLNVKEVETLLQDVADFTNDWMAEHTCYRVTFEDQYKKEWEKTPLGKNGYHIGQYNAMLLKSTLNYLIAKFVRKQMFMAYSKGVSDYMEKKCVSCYVTCVSGIDKYRLYDPDPNFRGRDKIEPSKLSTMQPDIAILWEYFDKYKLIEFEEQGDYMVARYFDRDTPARTLRELNALKYKHFNMGVRPRRQVLNLNTKQSELLEDLNPKKVTGARWW